MTARSVRLLPDPDSPTRPTACPAEADSETPRTACSVPSRQRDLDVEVVHLRAARSPALRPLHDAVGDEREREAGDHDGEAGDRGHVPLVRMKACPSWIIDPQSGVGGGTPRPR